MRRNAALAVATVLTCAAATAVAGVPARAAGWRNIGGAALAYDGSLDRVDFGAKNAGWAVGAAGSFLSPQAKIVRWSGSSWVADKSPVEYFG